MKVPNIGVFKPTPCFLMFKPCSFWGKNIAWMWLLGKDHTYSCLIYMVINC